MSKKYVLQNVVFWGLMLTAVTAERWMDLLCRVIFR